MGWQPIDDSSALDQVVSPTPTAIDSADFSVHIKQEGQKADDASPHKDEDEEAMEVNAEAEDVYVQTHLVQTHLLQTHLLKTQTTTLVTKLSVLGPAMAEPPEIPLRTVKIGEEFKEEATSQLQEETKR